MALERDDGEREAWHCPRCAGAALGVGDLVGELLEVAPHLRPPNGVRDPVARPREAIVARAATQPRPIAHLRAILRAETPTPQPRTWRRRLVTVVSLVAVLAALPVGLVGVLMVAIGSSSTGLDALAAPAGWIVLVIAALLFVVGGVGFVRAAR